MKGILYVLLLIPGLTTGQNLVIPLPDSTRSVTIGGYIDTYYTYFSRDRNSDFSEYVPYLVNSSRKESFSVNLAMIDFKYQSPFVRMRLSPGFGTYMNLNYSQEPGSLRNLVEANAGIKLSRKKEIWLDAGILGSPYTNENPLSRDHLMYTRSFSAENVPYYLCGLKVSTPITETLNLYVYLINGWQVIDDTNRGKSIGTHLEYKPDKTTVINWSTYVGDERNNPDPNYRLRLFTELNWYKRLTENWELTACAFVGNQQYENANDQNWWLIKAIGRYNFSARSSLSARWEHLSDRGSVVITNVDGVSGMMISSTGLCYNYKLHSHALFRMEGRYFYSPDSIYPDPNGPYSNALMLAASLTAWF